MDVTGAVALSNTARYGIVVDMATATSTIGRMPAAGNVTSPANGQDGGIFHVAAPGMMVQGNFIGTNAAGTAALALPERLGGYGTSSRRQRQSPSSPATSRDFSAVPPPGRATSSQAILVSASISSVLLRAQSIQGNAIGTDITGTNPLGNQEGGLYLDGATENNSIGGTGRDGRGM